MSIKQLRKEIEALKNEIYELSYADTSPELRRVRKEELEYKIFDLEQELEFELKMRPFKWMFIGCTIICSGILLIQIVNYFIAK